MSAQEHDPNALPAETPSRNSEAISSNNSPTIDETTPHATATEDQPSTAQSAIQQSISRANLETEVGQVLGTLNSWWGGVKKQACLSVLSR